MRQGATRLRWECPGASNRTRRWALALLLGGASLAPAAEHPAVSPPAATAAAATAPARSFYLSDDRLGTRTAPLLLLTRPEIQADLQLTPAQVASAQEAVADLHRRAEGLRGMGNGQDAAAARRAIDEAQQGWLTGTLSEEQQARLLQIDLQWEGPSALVSRASIVEVVGLDHRQVAALKARIVASRNDPATQRDPLARARAQLEDVQEVLDQTQQSRWLGLLGRPITFATAATATAPPVR